MNIWIKVSIEETDDVLKKHPVRVSFCRVETANSIYCRFKYTGNHHLVKESIALELIKQMPIKSTKGDHYLVELPQGPGRTKQYSIYILEDQRIK